MKDKFLKLSRIQKIAIVSAGCAVLGAVLTLFLVLLPVYTVADISNESMVSTDTKLKQIESRSKVLTSFIVLSSVVSFGASVAGGRKRAGKKSEKKR